MRGVRLVRRFTTLLDLAGVALLAAGTAYGVGSAAGWWAGLLTAGAVVLGASWITDWRTGE